MPVPRVSITTWWQRWAAPKRTSAHSAALASLLPSSISSCREDSVQVRTACWALVVAASAACAAAKPHTFGAYNDLTPKVTPKTGERTPAHVTIDLAKPANVAVFFVVRPSGLFKVESAERV